jgi:hypothetical protein
MAVITDLKSLLCFRAPSGNPHDTNSPYKRTGPQSPSSAQRPGGYPYPTDPQGHTRYGLAATTPGYPMQC